MSELSEFEAMLVAIARKPAMRAELRSILEEILLDSERPQDWTDQKRGGRILGRNKWCAAVRARLERDPSDPHARIIDGRYLLDAVGVNEELERAHKANVPVRKTEASTEEPPRLSRALRLLQGNK